MPAKSSAESGGSRVVPPVDCRSSHNLPNVDFWEDFLFGSLAKILILLVPGEGLEPPTNGLQNRCSTAELTRQKLEMSLYQALLAFLVPKAITHVTRTSNPVM